MSDLDQAKKNANQADAAVPPPQVNSGPGKGSATAGMNGGSPKASGIAGDPTYGQLQGAGDEAAFKVMGENVKLDTVLNVQADRSRVGEMISDITAHTKTVEAANKEDKDVEAQYGALSTNIGTKAKLSILDDKLDVGNVDTAAFGYQYKYAKTDFQRLVAEATEFTSLSGKGGEDAFKAVGDDVSGGGMKLAATPERERFRTARAKLATASAKMKGQLGTTRSAANRFQGSLYSIRAKAAAASKDEAATKLAGIRAEIEQVAQGVGTVVKIVSAIGGLAAGGGATGALATSKAGKEEGGGVDIDPSQSGLAKGGTVVLDPSGGDKGTKEKLGDQADLVKSIGGDVASVIPDASGPDGIAKALVTAMGNYANKEKIDTLSNMIIAKGAEEATFNAAAEAHALVAARNDTETEAGKLELHMTSFFSAKREMDGAGEELMAALAKGSAGAPDKKTGQKQARAVLFLKDADKFLAQVQTAIDVGDNQQKNLAQAALDRKKLRGTSAALEGGEEHNTATYFRCHKTESKGMLWGTNTSYRLEKVFVKFQDHGTAGSYNDVVQGGQGSVEGTGSASDVVANQIKTLRDAQAKVKTLQAQVQDALGMGAPVLDT